MNEFKDYEVRVSPTGVNVAIRSGTGMGNGLVWRVRVDENQLWRSHETQP